MKWKRNENHVPSAFIFDIHGSKAFRQNSMVMVVGHQSTLVAYFYSFGIHGILSNHGSCYGPKEAQMTKDLQAASLQHMIDIAGKKTNLLEVFQAGALWAIKHSPEVLKLVEALEGVERFIRVAGECSNNIVYENACLDHANECAEAVTAYCKSVEGK